MRPRDPRRLLRRAAGRWPRGAIAAADAVGWATQPLDRGLEADAVLRFVPGLDPGEVRRIRRATWTSWLRLRVLEAAIASPTARWPYPPLVGGVNPATLRPPLVLAGFHLGPIPALGALLEQLPGEVLVLHLSGAPRARLTIGPVGTDEWQRAIAFRRAVAMLRAGGFVFLLADANVVPSTLEVTMFGRTARLARGAFALSRVTGAPLVPVAARWRGRAVEIVAGERIAGGSEAETAAATAAWVERLVRESPRELGRLFADSF